MKRKINPLTFTGKIAFSIFALVVIIATTLIIIKSGGPTP